VLTGLFEGAREDAARREQTLPLHDLEKRARAARPVRDGLRALAPRDTIHVIAEIKRKSPSKGELAPISDPVSLALDYEAGGASVISVLTEGRAFGGSLADLAAVSEAVQVPVLRKDFLETEYQIIEARAHGADLVLLIMAGLSDERALRLMGVAQDWGMQALVEAHTPGEVDRAIGIGADIVGVNARDLVTFELDPTLFGAMVHRFPEGVLRVAESAVSVSQDVKRYREQGAHAVLVGEALVTGANPRQRVEEFVAA
jgi:indole-3-glycerol phosphate synthase